MIKPGERLWAGSGNLLFGDPYTSHITDLDQRRTFAVTYALPVANEDDEEVEEICFEQLRMHLDDLGEGVFGIRFTSPDGSITYLTDHKDGVTRQVNSHSLEALELPFPVKTISLESLAEIVRLGGQEESSRIRAARHMGAMAMAT